MKHQARLAMVRTRWMAIFALLLPFERPSSAEETWWKVGLASVKITPSEPLRMSGYASRTAPSQGVASDLYAKALAVEDQQGHRGVLVTSDVIGFTAAFAEPLCERITAQTGLSRNQILLNSSHTHTGPTLGLELSELDYPQAEAERTVAYSRSLQDKLVELVASSIDRLAPARLSWGVGVANFVMNRREFTERGVILGVNPRGLSDRSVPVLRIDGPTGELRGVVFGAACHNTTLTGRHMQISGDFAGYAQELIERSQQDVQALFVQGLAGDANPYPRGSEELARLHGASLGEEVLRVLQTTLQPVRGPLRTEWGPVELPLVQGWTAAKINALRNGRGGWRGFVSNELEKRLDAGAPLPTSYTTPIAVWQFGEDLTLVGLPGEVVVDYVSLLEEALGPRKLWLAAYCNDVFGYLPSGKTLEQGGYETRGLYAGSVGLFAQDAERQVVEAVRVLAERAGRKTENENPD